MKACMSRACCPRDSAQTGRGIGNYPQAGQIFRTHFFQRISDRARARNGRDLARARKWQDWRSLLRGGTLTEGGTQLLAELFAFFLLRVKDAAITMVSIENEPMF